MKGISYQIYSLVGVVELFKTNNLKGIDLIDTVKDILNYTKSSKIEYVIEKLNNMINAVDTHPLMKETIFAKDLKEVKEILEEENAL